MSSIYVLLGGIVRPLDIEKWMYDHDSSISEVSKALLEESILSYKVGAYRAAFIMSWLAFLNIVKDKLLSIDISSVDSSSGVNWDAVRRSLKKEDEWDKTVYQLLVKGKNTPFDISEKSRIEIKRWKEFRNKCAHGKAGIVSYYHIESFWAFIKEFVDKDMRIVGEVEGFVKRAVTSYEAFGAQSEEFRNSMVNILKNMSHNSIGDFLNGLREYFDENFDDYRAKIEFFRVISVILN